jgi:hypothetical protein
MFITIVVLQYIEATYYKNPKDVFPTMGTFTSTTPPGVPVVSPSAPTPTPVAEPAPTTEQPATPTPETK